MTMNPENPADIQARLMRLAAERKEKHGAAEEIDVKPELPPAGNIAEEVVAEIAKRFRFPIPSKEEMMIGEQEREERYRKELRDLYREERQAKFNRICPEKFREPWDWNKVREGVSPEEVGKVFGWQYGPRGLYIAGESGRCKTRALMFLIRRLIIKENRTVLFMDGVAFSNLCTRAFGKPDETEEIFAPLIRAEILAIDDLAKRWTPATEEGAFTVIDRRGGKLKPTLITLNYTTDDLFGMQQARGDLAAMRDIATPLIRRLIDDCELAVL